MELYSFKVILLCISCFHQDACREYESNSHHIGMASVPKPQAMERRDMTPLGGRQVLVCHVLCWLGQPQEQLPVRHQAELRSGA